MYGLTAKAVSGTYCSIPVIAPKNNTYMHISLLYVHRHAILDSQQLYLPLPLLLLLLL